MIDTKPLIEALSGAPEVFDWRTAVNSAMEYVGAKRLSPDAPIKQHHLVIAVMVNTDVRVKIFNQLGIGSLNAFDAVTSEVTNMFERETQAMSKPESELFSELGLR